MCFIHHENRAAAPHSHFICTCTFSLSQCQFIFLIGLIYDDLRIVNDEVREALSRLPPSVLAARDRRIKTAFDLSMKHKYVITKSWLPRPRGEFHRHTPITTSPALNSQYLRHLDKAQWTTIAMERELSYLEPTLTEVMNEVKLRKKFRAE